MMVWARCIGAASVLLSVISPANAYPDGPVRLLVGWPAGGPVDVVARLVQGELSMRLGTSVVIENKPGASGMLATDLLLSQRRDGQTLLLCTHYESMNPVMYRSANTKWRISPASPCSRGTTSSWQLRKSRHSATSRMSSITQRRTPAS